MSELAFNANGDSFEIPAAVTGWRVRRMKPRGAPELVYGRDGRPLTVPIECEMDDLRAAVGTLGRYRLDPVDDNGRVIEGVPAAYVQVVKAERTADETPAPVQGESDSVLREALRANTELAKAVVDRFPEMMHAAAELLRAADGAGLPARQPRLIEKDDADDDDDDDDGDDAIETPAGFDLNGLVAQLVPMIVMGFTSGKLKMPGLGALLDWRKAAPADAESSDARPKRKKKQAKETVVHADAHDDAANTDDAESGKASVQDEQTESTEMPPLDPAAMAHFIAIQSALSPDEASLAREVAGQLSPAELRAWFDELGKLGVDDAVKRIRKVVSGAGKTGGAA